MRNYAFALAIAVLGSSAAAQDTTALAQQYVNMPQVQQMVTDMFAPDAMGAQVVSSLPPNMSVTPDQQQRIGAVMSEAMNNLRPRMEELMVSGSADVFSAEELQALIDFYGSEHGAAVMSKMQPFMASIMGKLQPEMQALQAQVGPKIVEILQEQ